MQGRPGNATITPDSVGVDSAAVQGGDTTVGQDTGLVSTPQDTLGPRDPNAPAYPGGDTLQSDTSTMQGDTTGMEGHDMQSDTTMSDTTSTNQ
jgi:hypothetical protein